MPQNLKIETKKHTLRQEKNATCVDSITIANRKNQTNACKIGQVTFEYSVAVKVLCVTIIW